MDNSSTFSRKRLFALVSLLVILVAIPLTLYLAQKTQIFKPKALGEGSSMSFFGNGVTDNGNSATTTSQNIGVRLTWGPGGTTPTSNPTSAPTSIPTSPPNTPNPTPVGNIFTVFVSATYLDRTLVTAPIAQITATLTGPTGTKTAVTDSSGVATFSNLPAGNYTVTISSTIDITHQGAVSADYSRVYSNVIPLGYHNIDPLQPVSFTIEGPSSYSIPQLIPNSVTVSFIFVS